ncbi:hypothetical protein [Clostridium phage vB_CpeS-17DYC]|nr:hypothetical protein [Clostridium phage vB_CpeS-17DYC]
MKLLNGLTQTTPQNFQLDAGVWLTGVEWGSVSDSDTLKEQITTAMETSTNIIGATSGGGNISIVPEVRDLMEDVDGAIGMYKDCLAINKIECKATTKITEVKEGALLLALGCAGSAAFGSGKKISLRNYYKSEDFKEITWVASMNKSESYLVVRLRNAISTGGLNYEIEDKGKGKFDLEITPCNDLAKPNELPIEIYLV